MFWVFPVRCRPCKRADCARGKEGAHLRPELNVDLPYSSLEYDASASRQSHGVRRRVVVVVVECKIAPMTRASVKSFPPQTSDLLQLVLYLSLTLIR